MAVGSLVKSTPVGHWVTQRNGEEIGERLRGAAGKNQGGWGSQRISLGWEEGLPHVGCCRTMIGLERSEWTTGTLVKIGCLCSSPVWLLVGVGVPGNKCFCGLIANTKARREG